MSEITLPDNETINDYVVSALGEVDALNAGAYDWRTSIPYRDDDSDVIISNAVHCVKPLLKKVDALQNDLAAALARAEKAEGEVATTRKKGYTDGYAEGTVDGVHDLWNAIVDALNDAGRAGAIKAVHKVLAEYDNLYLK